MRLLTPGTVSIFLVSFSACKPDGRHEGVPSGPPSSSSATASASNNNILSIEVRKTICSMEPCGGDQPSINVYRDKSGAVRKLYRLYGSCSHSPGIYFDPDGTKLDIIPEKPIIVGSPEANELEARHQKHVGGLTMTDVIRCSDGLRLPPR